MERLTADPERMLSLGADRLVGERSVKLLERMIEVSGVELCAEAFGDPADPPILLVMGIGASMLWWEEGFRRMLAGGGRFVIRYDHRDTGRSVTYEAGHPEYTGADLIADAVGVLDAYEIAAAHVVGVSAGGAFAQLLALGFPDRVLSLVLISTSPAKPLGRPLPPATVRYRDFLASAEVDWSDQTSVIDYLIRMLVGSKRPVDGTSLREPRPSRRTARAQYRLFLGNHSVVAEGEPSLSAICVPTLVIHARPIRCSRSSTGRRSPTRSLERGS